MNLSRNFTLQELIKSDTAIRKGIDNNPNSDQVEKLKALCENVLQPVRDHFGRVKVTSGFRSSELCVAIWYGVVLKNCCLNLKSELFLVKFTEESLVINSILSVVFVANIQLITVPSGTVTDPVFEIISFFLKVCFGYSKCNSKFKILGTLITSIL